MALVFEFIYFFKVFNFSCSESANWFASNKVSFNRFAFSKVSLIPSHSKFILIVFSIMSFPFCCFSYSFISTLNSNLTWKLGAVFTPSQTKILNFNTLNNGVFSELYIEVNSNQYNFITFNIPKIASTPGAYDSKLMRKGYYLSSADNGDCALSLGATSLSLTSMHLNGTDVTSDAGMTVWYR